MINKNIVKQPKSVVEVQIAVPWADLEAKWNETLQRLAADVELSGFRKGTAPLNLVESQLGNKLQDEFLKDIMPQFLIEALKETDIVPIDYPNYQLVSFVKGQGLQYKATVTNRPQVSVGDYKKIKAVKSAVKPVSEEEVKKVIDDLYNRWKARQTPATQPSDATKKADGPVNTTGSISFNQDAQPVKASAEPDDEFAKAVGATSLADLKTKIRKDLEEHTSYNNELDFEEAILQEVAKMTQVEIPDILISDELNRMLVSLQRRVADMGLLLEDYLKSQNTTLEQLKDKWKLQAEQNVQMELGLAEIARSENIQISDGELQTEIDKIQDAKVKQQFESQEPRLHLKHALRQTRTLDLLKKLVTA